MNTPTKYQMTALLRAWIDQRPGLEYCNYGDPTAYRSEYRRIFGRAIAGRWFN